jgi:hypothetical protein
MSCDSTDQRRAQRFAQSGGEKQDNPTSDCLCDCAVVEALMGNGIRSEIRSTRQVNNIIYIKPKGR